MEVHECVRRDRQGGEGAGERESRRSFFPADWSMYVCLKARVGELGTAAETETETGCVCLCLLPATL